MAGITKRSCSRTSAPGGMQQNWKAVVSPTRRRAWHTVEEVGYCRQSKRGRSSRNLIGMRQGTGVHGRQRAQRVMVAAALRGSEGAEGRSEPANA